MSRTPPDALILRHGGKQLGLFLYLPSVVLAPILTLRLFDADLPGMPSWLGREVAASAAFLIPFALLLFSRLPRPSFFILTLLYVSILWLGALYACWEADGLADVGTLAGVAVLSLVWIMLARHCWEGYRLAQEVRKLERDEVQRSADEAASKLQSGLPPADELPIPVSHPAATLTAAATQPPGAPDDAPPPPPHPASTRSPQAARELSPEEKAASYDAEIAKYRARQPSTNPYDLYSLATALLMRMFLGETVEETLREVVELYAAAIRLYPGFGDAHLMRAHALVPLFVVVDRRNQQASAPDIRLLAECRQLLTEARDHLSKAFSLNPHWDVGDFPEQLNRLSADFERHCGQLGMERPIQDPTQILRIGRFSVVLLGENRYVLRNETSGAEYPFEYKPLTFYASSQGMRIDSVYGGSIEPILKSLLPKLEHLAGRWTIVREVFESKPAYSEYETDIQTYYSEHQETCYRIWTDQDEAHEYTFSNGELHGVSVERPGTGEALRDRANTIEQELRPVFEQWPSPKGRHP